MLGIIWIRCQCVQLAQMDVVVVLRRLIAQIVMLDTTRILLRLMVLHRILALFVE